MDDEKKKTVGMEIGGIVIAIGIIAIAPSAYIFLKSIFGPYLVTLGLYGTGALGVLKGILGIVVGLSFPLALFFLIGIIYCVEGLKKIRIKESEIHDLKVEPAYETAVEDAPGLSHRWESVVKHIESENPNDWRQAIIDADIILDDLLNKLGYRGESVGEKLKRVVEGDFKTIRDAWDAHMVRNQLAHQGSEVPLDHHEARRVVNLYKKVFQEFYYI